jgi:hypothetical protein
MPDGIERQRRSSLPFTALLENGAEMRAFRAAAIWLERSAKAIPSAAANPVEVSDAEAPWPVA